MSDQSGPSHLQVLFEAALKEYEKQTGIVLTKHPLAEELQNCDSVESVTTIFHEQTQAFSQFRGEDKVFKPLKNTLSILHKLSATADTIGLPFSPVKAVHTGLAVLLSTVKGVIDSYDALVDLLESIEHFLNRLDIHTRIPHTVAMTEMVVKILIELLSALALVTKQIKKGKAKKLVKKFLGENEVEAVIQRLDRLTQDEARITAAQTLEVVYGLVQNMRVVMDDGKASVDFVRDALETIQRAASNINRSERDELEQRVRSWLSPPDPWKNHNIACKSRHRGSAIWFIQGNTFSEWKTSEDQGSLLWVHGKPGAGKSVLSSTIIEDIDAMRKAGLASLAFFYCDFREDNKRDLRGLLSSLLVQLCHQSGSYSDMLSKFYSEHAKGSRDPSDDVLVGCLKNLLKVPGLAPVYLIIDALDECPNSPGVAAPRDEVLNLIEELINSQIPNLRICVTSRPETDIKDVLDPLIFRSVSLHDEDGQKKDIDDYIKSVINTNRKNKRWKTEDKQLVIGVLSKKADGMFRWVYCQVDYICGLIPARIRHALAGLPETLDDTYRRTLREIKKAEWEIAHRLLQFVAVACRPLHAKELAELLAFDFEEGPIPKFREDWRLEDPFDAVLSTCSSLVAVVDSGGSVGKVIQFSHYSVKEFLTSTRLAESGDIILRRYHVSTAPAHTLAAQACLGILLHLDKDSITRDSLEEFPLAKYAAEYWADHARLEDVFQKVEDGTKQLFDPNKSHLAVCVWIHDPEAPAWRQSVRNPRPSPPHRTPLHYASFWGLHSIVESLVIEHAQDLHSRCFTDNATPLHLASEKGHVNVVRFLLERDADVAARNKDRDTPLHLVSKVRQVEVAVMLIERGADVSARNKYGLTPLHLASIRGQVEIASILLERGADVSAQNRDGETPLHLASQKGQAEVAGMLIERGADVTVQTNYGSTPLYLALQMGQVEVVDMFIERDADVTTQNKDGETPLHLALQEGHVEVASKMIDHATHLTAQNKYGETALHLALQKGNVEIASKIIARATDLTAQNKYGQTALHLASQNGQVEVAGMLIERGADLTAQNNAGETALHLASQKGNMEAAGMLIERGADLTARNKDGETALHQALQKGQVEVAGMLIERGADVTAREKDGWTPLHLASLKGKVAIAGMIIEQGADLTAQNNDGETALHLALQKGQVEVASMLIERGADLTSQNRDGETALHLALQKGQVEVASMLIERGANSTTQNKDGETALHLALQKEQVEVVSMLIERGADVAAQTKDGWSPLHMASQKGQVAIAGMLIERGADSTAQNNDGETALHLALQKGQVEVVSMLIERGADVTAQTKDGWTPLHLASQKGQVAIAGMLIERGADFTAENKDGETALHLASQKGQLEIAGMLIERGADVKARTKDRWTPLHLALQMRKVAIARMLIERGADVTAQGKYGLTPLDLALLDGQVEVVATLIERGADMTGQNKNGETALHLALQNWHVEVMVGMLIEHGVDVTAQNKDGETALHLASQKGEVAIAGMLIERGADVTAQSKRGLTPLHLALQKEEMEVVAMLIERGADSMTVRTEDGWTPLHLASQKGQMAITGMLIERGADVTAQSKSGMTPLHLASLYGHVEVAGVLIERGADVTAQDKNGETALHLASIQSDGTLISPRGCAEVARILLEHGADATVLDEYGRTPFDLAKSFWGIEEVRDVFL